MGVNALTAAEIRKRIPARILSLGYPDHLEGNVNLTGCELISVDIIRHRGVEVVVDLSVLQPPGSPFRNLGEFGLVIDCGTIEHCSNPANAFINAATAVRPGGTILHELPLNMTNHGYWNISPVWFTDFYKHNGFVIEEMKLHMNGGYYDAKVAPWPSPNDPNHNMFILDRAACTMCIAKRVTMKQIVLPQCQQQWLA